MSVTSLSDNQIMMLGGSDELDKKSNVFRLEHATNNEENISDIHEDVSHNEDFKFTNPGN